MSITRIQSYARIRGTTVKIPCKVATTTSITLSGTQTIDGVSIVAGDRVLVKDQGTGADNGIYMCDASTWSRDVDLSSDDDTYQGILVLINQGTTYADVLFQLTTADPITLGTTALTFSQYSSAGDSVVYDTGKTSGYNVLTFPTTDAQSCTFEYALWDTSAVAYRAGTVISVWHTTAAEYTEFATKDLGASTAAVTFAVSVSAGNVRFQATISSGTWNISLRARKL